MAAEQYDLFLSLAGPDRTAVQPLCTALVAAGLRVFLDVEDIREHESINARIEGALRSSRALLAFYSASYTSRPACQWELTAAFLAGQREGDPMRRIIVVNPEDPHTDHLLPAELADAKYERLPDGRSLDPLVRRIITRLAPITGTFGTISFNARPKVYGRAPGLPGFVGRYREQWALHTALIDPDLPLSRGAAAGPLVSLVGMPGIGKTALAAAYAWFFGAEYAGGEVRWLNLADTDRSTVLDRYTGLVRLAAESVGLAAASMSREWVVRMVGDHLDALPGPSLWIIDNVPDGLDPEIVHQLVIPTRARLRTVLITRTEAYADLASPVRVGPMTPVEAVELLQAYRRPAAGERDAFDRLIGRLGGHPFLIRHAGNQMRDRDGIVAVADHLARLSADGGPMTAAAALLADTLASLGPAERLALQLAAAVAPIGVPAGLIAGVLRRFPTVAGGMDPAGTALAGLRARALATRSDTIWSFHSLVLDAQRRGVTLVVPADELAAAATAVLDGLAADPAASLDERAALIRHAEALIAGAAAAPADDDTLRRRVASWYETRGELPAAAAHRDRVADRNPGAAADLAAAAAAWHAAGEPERAIDRATRALELARGLDAPTAYRARRTLAEALDAVSSYERANPHWAALLDPPAAIAPVDRLNARAAHLRALLLRGDLSGVKLAAPALIAAAPAGHDIVQQAQLELARAETLTDGQRQARERARKVLDHYEQRGLPEHARALEATEVLAQSWLTLGMWEFRPDPQRWVRAEQELRELRDRYRASHGDTNMLTLGATVEHAYALVSLGSMGRRDEGWQVLADVRPVLTARLGPRHPFSLRAAFLSGLVHAQLHEHDEARALFEEARDGQRSVLGTRHPHTLRTQYELAVAMGLQGDQGWRPLLDEVRRLAPPAVGRANDLSAQAFIATVLLRLPSPLLRWVDRLVRP